MSMGSVDMVEEIVPYFTMFQNPVNFCHATYIFSCFLSKPICDSHIQQI